MLAIMPSSGGLPTFMLRREEQKQRIIWGKLMIKGKHSFVARRLGTAAMVTCAAPSYLAKHGTPHSI
ncbi:hypothetical protein MJI52_11495, partial [Salmonella enterica subsp. enterica serovar Montevideo]|nr:hypothetical protein [Salmonella enterica subsp. enterica serovar Montevideo]